MWKRICMLLASTRILSCCDLFVHFCKYMDGHSWEDYVRRRIDGLICAICMKNKIKKHANLCLRVKNGLNQIKNEFKKIPSIYEVRSSCMPHDCFWNYRKILLRIKCRSVKFKSIFGIILSIRKTSFYIWKIKIHSSDLYKKNLLDMNKIIVFSVIYLNDVCFFFVAHNELFFW